MTFARRTLPPALLGAAILFMSGPWGASSNTEDVLLGVGFAEDLVEFLNHALRTLGHVSAYALFAVLALRARRGEGPTTTRAVILALVTATVLASVDETIQSLVPSRGGKWTDVLLDTCGAAVALGLVWRRAAKRRGLEHPARRDRAAP